MKSEIVQEWEEHQKQILASEWTVGFHDRGMGHGDFGVILEQTTEEIESLAAPIVVVKCETKELAEHIALAHNEKLKASSDSQLLRNIGSETADKSREIILKKCQEWTALAEMIKNSTLQERSDRHRPVRSCSNCQEGKMYCVGRTRRADGRAGMATLLVC